MMKCANLRMLLILNMKKKDYLNQHRDLEKFYEEYFGEPLFNPFITYPYRKNFYRMQVIDLRGFHVDHQDIEFDNNELTTLDSNTVN